MKTTAIFALLAAAASLTACAYPDPNAADVGNPNHFAYAGEAGSAYDPAVNPPKNIGQVAYDPNQPLPNNLPADAALPPPATSGNAVTMAPLGTAPANPMARPPIR